MVRGLASNVNPFDANVLQRFVRRNVPGQRGGVGTSDQTLNPVPDSHKLAELYRKAFAMPDLSEDSGKIRHLLFTSRAVRVHSTPQL